MCFADLFTFIIIFISYWSAKKNERTNENYYYLLSGYVVSLSRRY